MFRSLIQSLLILSVSATMLHPITLNVEPTTTLVKTTEQVEDRMNVDDIKVFNKVSTKSSATTVTDEPQYPLTKEEINLIALVTMAEAEGESELGKRLVIDTILNRADHDYRYWPDTVTEVIYQKGQFEAMWNGRVDECYVMDEIVQLVKEELVERTNAEVLYFRTGRYSSYGTPAFKEGNHYFSNY